MNRLERAAYEAAVQVMDDGGNEQEDAALGIRAQGVAPLSSPKRSAEV